MTPAELQARVAAAFRQFSQGDLTGAEAALNELLRAAPDDFSVLSLLAETKRQRGDAAAALPLYDRALQRRADHAPTQQGKALALIALGRETEAIASFDAAIVLRPADAALHYNRARCLQSLGRLDEALASFDKALALTPGAPDILHNRGVVLHWLGRVREAQQSFDASLQARPDNGETLYTKGVTLLAAGDFAHGWPLHEQRRRPGVLANMRDESRGAREWRGERLAGALRIWPEQGIGDEVLFARLAPLARTRTPNVVLECAERLVPLFARSFPDLAVRSVEAHATGAEAQIAAGSLGVVLNAGVAQLGNGAPYLEAHAEQRAALRARYEKLANGRPIVGIAWISKNPSLGAHKSTRLADWEPLLRRDALFVNLQYGDVAAEIADAQSRFGCTIHNDPEVDQLADLDAFAAQAAAMDQIVSVSNTTVHIAGALGVRCAVLVPPAQGLLWYWGVSGERTPWYASVRVLRRAPQQSWADHVAAAAAALL